MIMSMAKIYALPPSKFKVASTITSASLSHLFPRSSLSGFLGSLSP